VSTVLAHASAIVRSRGGATTLMTTPDKSRRRAYARIPANWDGLPEDEKKAVTAAIATELQRRLRPANRRGDPESTLDHDHSGRTEAEA
jgi:hypothetical protein